MHNEIDFDQVRRDIEDGSEYEELLTLSGMLTHFNSLNSKNGVKLINDYILTKMNKYEGRDRRAASNMQGTEARCA